MNDLISRDNLSKYKEEVGCNEPIEVDAYYGGWNNAIDCIIENEPSAQEWIPVSERLPEEDKEVLITYKGKGDELDKPYSNIDITTYGQMYFGGNKVGNYKHWRSPFQYFNDNYEVTAWMPVPEPYKGGDAK